MELNILELSKKIEALLFYKGEAMKLGEITRALSVSKEDMESALADLKEKLRERGIRLIKEGEYAALATAPEAVGLIEALRREELEGPLGRAGLETLAIIIYHGPIARTDIEYIRGVNSSSILRSLLVRGLVEKVENPNDKRSFLYRPTPELPAALGIASTSEAPNFEDVRASVQQVLENRPSQDEGTNEVRP